MLITKQEDKLNKSDRTTKHSKKEVNSQSVLDTIWTEIGGVSDKFRKK